MPPDRARPRADAEPIRGSVPGLAPAKGPVEIELSRDGLVPKPALTQATSAAGGSHQGARGWMSGRDPMTMWLRSAAFTILLPGTATVMLPAAILASRPGAVVSLRDPRTWVAGVAIAAGAAGLLRCIWEFAARGRGTLAPVDPPTRLVVSGLYRYVRNPMYVCVVTILAGEALLWRSAALGIYAGAFLAVTHAFILIHEEPALRQTFGASYTAYTRSVSRWIPRRPHAP